MDQKPSFWSKIKFGQIALALLVGYVAPLVLGNTVFKGQVEEQVKVTQLKLAGEYCVEKATNDPMRETRLAELQEATSQTRNQVVTDFGWALTPGLPATNTAIARKCVTDSLKLAVPA